MSLPEAEKTAITSKVAGHTVHFGGEALERLFLAFPLTKRYFSHMDMRNGSRDVQHLGKLFMRMINNCVEHLDELEHHKSLFSVSDCHFQQLLNNPSEYKVSDPFAIQQGRFV
ncbi:hemoglobin subunit alpha-5-like [Leptodactylus fuscus]|uniref:hemoglobin subunit alpha-5-like n=1 Tax=Leptodactylus fuscus TaxID=238119 RepID=UPI003F4F1267